MGQGTGFASAGGMGNGTPLPVEQRGEQSTFGSHIMSHTVVLVGHCGVDGPRLQSQLSQLPDVKVTRVNSPADLERSCREGHADLLLVNREPVGFDEEGIDIVRQIANNYPDTKVM